MQTLWLKLGIFAFTKIFPAMSIELDREDDEENANVKAIIFATDTDTLAMYQTRKEWRKEEAPG